LTPLNWKLNFVLLLSYALIGSAAGVVSGLALAALHARRGAAGALRTQHTKAAAALPLLLAIMAVVLRSFPLALTAVAQLATAALVLAAIVHVLLKPSSGLARWIDFNPWFLSLILLGPSWVVKEATPLAWPAIPKALLSGLFGISLVLASVWMQRWRAHPARWHVASAAMILVLLMAVGVTESHAHLTPAPGSGPPPTRLSPNVVLVTMDTTRADHFSLYGYGRDTTPYLTEFAKGATVFTQAWAASDFTLPSHASIFTGVYPSWHGARPFGAQPLAIRALDGKLPTLAGILDQRGYRTLAVAANTLFLSAKWGLNRGFQAYDVKVPVPVMYSDLRRRVSGLLDHFMTTASCDAAYLGSAKINQEVFRLLEQSSSGGPFLLFVNYMDAHLPYGIAPEAFQKRFPAQGRSPTSFAEMERDVIGLKRPIRDEERAALSSDYDRGIAYEDSSLSVLFDWLRQKGLYDDTLIIVTSDHGEAFGEHSLVGHGALVYENEVHIPLVIKYPRQKDGRLIAAPVSHVDLLPTILDCLGFRAPEHLQGQSLLSEGLRQDRKLFTESFPLNYFTQLNPKLNRIERAMRVGSLKLIVSSNGHKELYDLATDPEETRDLYGSDPAQARKLSALFHEWECHLPRQTAEPSSPVDDGMLKRLKSLGYVQ